MSEYVTVSVRLPKELHLRLKCRAEKTGEQLQDLLVKMLAMADALFEEEEVQATSFREPSPRWKTRSPAIESFSAEAPEPVEDDPLFHIADLTRPEEVIAGERPTDTAERHDYYLYGVDLDTLATPM